ncbi:MAG: polyribonucleotide nucleotidyltransferase [Candidatus Buchananbacteria bacterium]|nr:polyribonucleotide nucleotidyltransferase [Candidatus Buchananbacteria bacterium]
MQTNKFEVELAGKKLIVENGSLAKQAGGSCTVRYGDTVVLATATMGGIREGVDYFPLSVEYEERLYAAGKIKGSRWIKREGRPSDESVLTSRLIDRAIRPLFSKKIKNEVQVVLTVLSFDQENDSDVVALVAASIALAISNIPWAGPLAGLRVGRADGEFIINPSFEVREKSDLDLIVAGKDGKVLMIESGSLEVKEDDVFKAIEFSTKYITQLVDFINGVVKEIGQEKVVIDELVETDEEETPEAHKQMIELAVNWIEQNVTSILFDQNLVKKAERKNATIKIKDQLLEYLESQNIGKDRRKKALPLVDEFIEQEITRAIIEQDKRVDGRALTEIRPLDTAVGILPRTHGSGLFNRGETQVLSIVTLGSPGDEQQLEGLEVSTKKRYMHHYNFPPYSVGETGRIGSPGRREIGHGALAEKALMPVLPTKEEFPYTIRVVSEVLGSNGSSSMGATCGSTLALMDAGVPIKKPVAGIAMGLASDKTGKYKILTDLQDLEDGPGGMDFKVAGTVDGITAIQLDTKTDGLTLEIVEKTLHQALAARMEILTVMAQAIAQPRADLSSFAPRIEIIKINPDKIRDVIGPGGKIINEIIDKTGVQIDIEQDGTVMITSVDQAKGKEASDWVKSIVKELQVGEIYEGTISRLLDFGAIVELLPNKDGMVHISEISHQRVNDINDALHLGDKVKVKVIGIDGGKVSLSMKALLPRPENAGPENYQPHGGPRDKKSFFKKHPRN